MNSSCTCELLPFPNTFQKEVDRHEAVVSHCSKKLWLDKCWKGQTKGDGGSRKCTVCNLENGRMEGATWSPNKPPYQHAIKMPSNLLYSLLHENLAEYK